MLGGCGNVLYYQTPLMVRHMQGVIKETTRTIHDQSVREPTARRSGAVERTEQHGNTTSIGVVTRRRHPQEHDERFRNKVRKLYNNAFFIFCHLTFSHILLL